MILVVLGCIDFTISLSKSLMWHVLIGWCKLKGLHYTLSLLNLISFKKGIFFKMSFVSKINPFS